MTPAGLNLETGEIAARLAERPGVVDALVLERPWGEPGAVCAVLVDAAGLRSGRSRRRRQRGAPRCGANPRLASVAGYGLPAHADGQTARGAPSGNGWSARLPAAAPLPPAPRSTR